MPKRGHQNDSDSSSGSESEPKSVSRESEVEEPHKKKRAAPDTEMDSLISQMSNSASNIGEEVRRGRSRESSASRRLKQIARARKERESRKKKSNVRVKTQEQIAKEAARRTQKREKDKIRKYWIERRREEKNQKNEPVSASSEKKEPEENFKDKIHRFRSRTSQDSYSPVQDDKGRISPLRHSQSSSNPSHDSDVDLDMGRMYVDKDERKPSASSSKGGKYTQKRRNRK
jgi:hypothetical protein